MEAAPRANLADLFAQVKAPPPKIQIDARKLGAPWYVDEETNDVFLMFDELVIAWHPTLDKLVAQFIYKGSVVNTQPIEGHPGFKDDDGIIHMTELYGKLKVASAEMVPNAG